MSARTCRPGLEHASPAVKRAWSVSAQFVCPNAVYPAPRRLRYSTDVWRSPDARSCWSAADAADWPLPRLAQSRSAAALSDAVMAWGRFACWARSPPEAMTAMATGTLLVDHATALRSDPARSTRRSMPSGDTASPSWPPSEAARRAKLARSAAERIHFEGARGALAGCDAAVAVLVSSSAPE